MSPTPEIPFFDYLTGATIYVGSMVAFFAATLEKRAPLRCAFWLTVAIVLCLAGTEEISDMIGLSVPQWADADEAKITLSIGTPFALVVFSALYRLRRPALLLLFLGLLTHVAHLALLNGDAASLPKVLTSHLRFLREFSEMMAVQIYLAMMLVVVRVVAATSSVAGGRRKFEPWRHTILTACRYMGTWRIVHGMANARFLLWRFVHPAGSFGDYYAYAISRKIATGKPHRTLGFKNWSPVNAFDRRAGANEDGLRLRGMSMFRQLRDEGILPHHRCVDFGCGSLRVGQHLIEFLDPSRYLGMDVTDAFYWDGLHRIGLDTLSTKQPRFAIINDSSIEAAAAELPDFVISTSVLQHVPPGELVEFGRKLRRLCSASTTILVTFHRASRTIRTAPMSWAYDDATVGAALLSDRGWQWQCHEFGSPRHAGDERWTLTLATIRRQAQQSDDGAGSAVLPKLPG